MRLHRSALYTASFAALAMASFGHAAAAQTQPQGSNVASQDSDVIPDPEIRPEIATQETGSIVVTGSRIRTQQYDFASPVVAIDRSAIQSAGVTNITSFLTENPALVGSTTSNDTSGTNAGIGAVGLNLLNLRNLGTQRTLTLVDGRRHVAAVPGSASVDTNTIPVELIERIDVVTGAASAVYGADAVTGVVNFILRRDFEGIAARAQAGISEYGDNGNQFVSLVAGTNFAGGRGNIAIAGEYSREQAFKRNTRSFLRPEGMCGFYRNFADGTGADNDPNVPDNILECNVGYFDSHPLSAIDIDWDTEPDLFGQGEPWDPGRYLGGAFQAGGSGTRVGTYSGDLLPRIERYNANLLFNYDLTDTVNFYVQGKYSRVVSETENQPSFDFFLLARPDNAFLPDAVRDAMFDYGDPDFGVLITGRDNFDIGRRGSTATRETYRGVIGVTADLAPNLNLDVSYVYGQSDNNTFQTNYRYNDRFFAAIDAIEDPSNPGRIICRSDLFPAGASNQPYVPFDFGSLPAGQRLSFTPGANSGCVPFNLFADNSLNNQAAIDWITTEANDFSRIRQHVASAVLTGDMGDSFRLWGDAIGFALGAEYRKESSNYQPDPIGANFPVFGNNLQPTVGSFDVREAFAELRLPIVSDRPFFHDLTATGAVRYSDYSTIGSTFTWQINGVYAPIRDLRFRATYGEAVRAPNIAELFNPGSQTFQFFNDPCAVERRDNGTDLRIQNCQTILSGLGLSQSEIDEFTGATTGGANVPGFAGGNPDLQEETATTFTVGAVAQPRFLPGLAFSVDYYDVKLSNAISTPAAQVVAELCVDQPLPNQFCDSIERNATGGTGPAGVISGFRVVPQNVAEFRTTGIDFSANYRLATANAGIFNFRFAGNYLDRLEFLPIPGGSIVNDQNMPDSPKWQLSFNTTWAYNNFSLTHRFNYFSATRRYSRTNRDDVVAPEYFFFSERATHDFQASVQATENMSFYGGVNNAFGQLPDVAATWYPVPAIGRYFYFGARVNLPTFR